MPPRKGWRHCSVAHHSGDDLHRYTFLWPDGLTLTVDGPPGESPALVWEATVERARLARDAGGCFGRWLPTFRRLDFAWEHWLSARRDASALSGALGEDF